MDFDTNQHSVFLLHYHLIMCIKYRNKVIDDPISLRLKEMFEYIAPKYHITMEEWNHESGIMISIMSMFFSVDIPIQKSVNL